MTGDTSVLAFALPSIPNLTLFQDRSVPKPGVLLKGRKLMRAEGQALIEFALLVPLLFLLIVNVVNFGGFFYAWITIANAARAGAQYAVVNSSSYGGPTAPTGTQINTVITQDISSLLNAASLTVNICQNNNGTVTTIRGTCSGVASDPEPATYILELVDLTYTYQAFIPLFSFPSLGIHGTLPPTAIHRQAYMRLIK